MADAAPIRQGTASRPTVPRELPSDFHTRNPSLGLGGLFHKIHRNWQDYGWNTTVKKTLAYLIRSVYFRQVYRIYRIDINPAGFKRSPRPNPAGFKWSPHPNPADSEGHPHPVPTGSPSAQRADRKNLRPEDTEPPANWDASNFTFKFLTAEDRDAVTQIETIAEWLRGRLHGAIAGGQPCLVALDGDRVAGFNLISFEHAAIPLVNLTRRLRTGCAWSEQIAVRKEYRRAGLGAQLRRRIFGELARKGIRRLYGGTLVSNAASLSLARSVGFEEIVDIHYRKFLSHEKWRYKRVRG